MLYRDVILYMVEIHLLNKYFSSSRSENTLLSNCICAVFLGSQFQATKFFWILQCVWSNNMHIRVCTCDTCYKICSWIIVTSLWALFSIFSRFFSLITTYLLLTRQYNVDRAAFMYVKGIHPWENYFFVSLINRKTRNHRTILQHFCFQKCLDPKILTFKLRD